MVHGFIINSTCSFALSQSPMVAGKGDHCKRWATPRLIVMFPPFFFGSPSFKHLVLARNLEGCESKVESDRCSYKRHGIYYSRHQ